MNLGTFSVSLAVKDIRASEAFYTKLGFSKMGGDIEQNWLILSNGTATIGLFQGMFDSNILTFTPGWNADMTPADPFDDVRDIQKQLEAEGIELQSRVDADSTGPGHFMLRDPDGNTILVDQHR